uniref:Histone-lysine N-methyltransferase SETMAR n=1 Tax=Caenorhabditis japonica TaxID=281687 RepID=A0A8R1EFP0_CAEJA
MFAISLQQQQRLQSRSVLQVPKTFLLCALLEKLGFNTTCSRQTRSVVVEPFRKCGEELRGRWLELLGLATIQRNWFARFQLGEKCFEDNNRCGRPTTLNNDLLRHQLASLALALREKRPRRSAVHLLHDSARRHVTKATQAKLQELHWDTVSHPPYSPDIAPSDYHLFRPLKLFLKEKRFAKYEDLKIAVLDFFDSQSAAFWKKGIDDSCD